MQTLSSHSLEKVSDNVLRKYARQYDTPFLLLNRAAIKSNYEYFRSALPRVDVYYALKACGDPMLVKAMHDLGIFFDVSSIGELKLLSDLEIKAERCFYTHPYKSIRDIEYAILAGCKHFVFDCSEELQKFIAHKDQITLCLRIGFSNANANLDLSSKFGCDPCDAKQLLELASSLGFRVTTLAFHVGSQSTQVDTFGVAIDFCVALLNETNYSCCAQIDTIDIGGGFPVSYADIIVDKDHFFAYIAEKLCLLPQNIRIIAEPGRFLVASAVTSISSIIAKTARSGIACYYLDDGIYGSYSGIIYDRVVYPIDYLFYNEEADYLQAEQPLYVSKLFGPSCDSSDVVAQALRLPILKIGDYIIGRMMGAYTVAHATRFSCMNIPRMVLLR